MHALRPNWTELNWQPSGSIPVSATNSSQTYKHEGTTPRALDFGIATARSALLLVFSTPLLEILPRLRGAIIVSGERMRVHRCSHLRIRVPEPFANIGQWHPGGEQVRPMTMSKGMETGTIGQLESPT